MVDPVTNSAKSIMSDWSAQKPCFALMGEYSVGKSSLLNLLLGTRLLPARVTATRLPTVWLTYGEHRKVEALDYDGTLSAIENFEGDFDNLSEKLVIRCTLPSDILRNKDIIDTPGISDPNLADDIVGLIAPHVDFVVWCTAASQAWRQTESAAWDSVPYQLQDNSILAVTRIDLVAKQSDVKRILKRCERDAGKSFQSILPVSAKIAHSKSADSWHASGAAALVAALEARTAVSEAHRAERLEREGISKPFHEMPSAENPNAVEPQMRDVQSGVTKVPEDTKMTSNDSLGAAFSQSNNTFSGDKPQHDADQSVAAEVLLPRVNKDKESLAVNDRPKVAAANETETPRVSKTELRSKTILVPHENKGETSPEILTSKEENMSIDITALSSIGGFIGACLVDSETGLMMASEGGGSLDLEAAGAANTEVVKAKLAAIEMLGLNDSIDDILITLGKQFHLIRPLEKTPTVFLYVALDKKSANLGMARVQVKNVEKTLSL